MIVSPKTKTEQIKFRWDPDLCERVRRIAERTKRRINETGELLMRSAVERSELELELADSEDRRRRK